MIPYSKTKLNFSSKLTSETYHPKNFFRFFNIKLFFQDKNVFASKTFSETYHLKPYHLNT